VLAGATGLVGSQCLQQLLASPHYAQVIVLTRRPLPAAVRSPRLREVVADFARLDDVPQDLRADHVYCALGTTLRQAGSQAKFREVDFEYPRHLAQLTLAQGARHYSLVSAMGASARSAFFYSRVKGELEDALLAMGWPSLCFVRPSVIAGARAESRPLERISERVLRYAPRAWRSVPAATIAAAMMATALRAPPGLTTIESADIGAAAAAAPSVRH
jgi:uncharacterized protein YbjT (DUF2867 family)